MRVSLVNLSKSNFWKRNLPSNVRIVEVGPRDGLQNEKAKITTKLHKEEDGLSNGTHLKASIMGLFRMPVMFGVSVFFYGKCTLLGINHMME